MLEPMSWFKLSAQSNGTKVVFTEDVDIYPLCVIRKGTTGTIFENGLNEIWGSMWVLPDDEDARIALAEWEGCVALPQSFSGPVGSSPAPYSTWWDHSPVGLTEAGS